MFFFAADSISFNCIYISIFQGDSDKSSASGECGYKKCAFCSQVLGAKDVPKLLECLHVTCNACITTKFNEIDRNQPAVVLCPVSLIASD